MFSILIPWFTVREVKVDIEVVGTLIQNSVYYLRVDSHSPPFAAVPEGGDPTVRERYAARPHSSDIALHDHGVPCLRDYLVSRHPDHLRIYRAHTAADANFREGTHAKYHYLICGVQGDFTRSLVENPPKTLWTRELKVGRAHV